MKEFLKFIWSVFEYIGALVRAIAACIFTVITIWPAAVIICHNCEKGSERYEAKKSAYLMTICRIAGVNPDSQR